MQRPLVPHTARTHRRPLVIFATVAGLLGATLALGQSGSAGAGTALSEFTLPCPATEPADLAVGPDGALWFTETNCNRIGRIDTAGNITDFAIPTAASIPIGITAGPDGALWFSESATDKVGRMTTGGTVTNEFPETGGPTNITAGPDGNIWVTNNNDTVGRMTTAGVVTTFAVTPGSFPRSILTGPDGNLWFNEVSVARVARMTPTGVLTEFPTPRVGSDADPFDLANGPDGALWYAKTNAHTVGRMATDGSLVEYSTGAEDIISLATGADGNLYGTAFGGGNLVMITPAGVMTALPVALSPNPGPTSIILGPDGNLWFLEQFSSKIGRLTITVDPTTTVTEPPTTVPPTTVPPVVANPTFTG